MNTFLADFAELSTIGATAAGGVDRQAATAADGQSRHWLAAWLTQRGFTVEYDRIGNQFGLFELVPGAPYVLVGSHLDSQPLGGRYDGAYGVLAAAHAAHRLVESRGHAGPTPRFNVGVVNWFNEEGCRFEPSMMGSSVFTGKLDLDEALSTTDFAGIAVRDALATIDTIGAGEGPSVAGYAEIHIEQGRILSEEGTTIGLVDSTWAASKYRFAVYGEQSHTGSTVMRDRKDALLGAALLVVAAREISDCFIETPLHSSVGRLVVYPNSPVVVAREVRMHLDMRSASEDVLAQADAMLDERIPEIEQRASVRIEKATAHRWGVLSYHPQGVTLARECAAELGLSYREIMTIAGHDSTNVKDVVPAVMLFVPSMQGISHNEKEFTEDADISDGLELLSSVVRRLCDGELAE